MPHCVLTQRTNVGDVDRCGEYLDSSRAQQLRRRLGVLAPPSTASTALARTTVALVRHQSKMRQTIWRAAWMDTTQWAVLREVVAHVAEARTLSAADVRALDVLVPALVAPALEAVDQRWVVQLQANKSKRTALRFESTHAALLLVLDPAFCSCTAFASSLGVNAKPYCRHLLAAQLADALGSVKRVQVAEGDFVARCTVDSAAAILN